MTENFGRHLANLLKALILPVGMYLLLVLIAKAVGRNFGSWMQIKTVIMQTARPLFITFGISFAMKSGRMDFASGALATMIGMLSSNLVINRLHLSGTPGLAMFVILAVLLGIIFGAVNGLVYIHMHVPGIVCTLGLCMIYETLGYLITDGGSNTIMDFGMMYFGRAPGIFFFMITGAILFYIIWNKTPIGYHVRAVGQGQIMARNVGVNIQKISVIAFICSGVFYGMCGVVYQSFSGTLYPSVNFTTSSLMFDGVIALIVADYISQYCGMTIACFLAAFSFKMLTAGLVAIGLPSEFQGVLQGVFIILFTFFTSMSGLIEKKRHDAQRAAVVMQEIGQTVK